MSKFDPSKTKKGRKVSVTMSHAAYKEMLKLDGIEKQRDVLDYINQTWGILGTVVDIQFED